MQVDKYTYSVCPFKDAFQKEGSSKTSLGTWAGLTDDSTVMKFSNGQACWQGPARSMTVGHTHYYSFHYLELNFHTIGIINSAQCTVNQQGEEQEREQKTSCLLAVVLGTSQGGSPSAHCIP